MRKIIRFKSQSKAEYKMIGENKITMFEWAKLKKDTYIIYVPPIFRKQTGGNLAIISEKRLMKMINITNKD